MRRLILMSSYAVKKYVDAFNMIYKQTKRKLTRKFIGGKYIDTEPIYLSLYIIPQVRRRRLI